MHVEGTNTCRVSICRVREFALGKIFLKIYNVDSTRESRQLCSVLQWTNIIVISLCVHSPRLSSSHFCLYFETEITCSGIIDHGEDKLLVER